MNHPQRKKLWNLFYGKKGDFLPHEGQPTKEELKSIHKLIKKVTGDIETFSYNTSISAFMICVNELGQLKCSNSDVLGQLVVLLAPFAPHLAEELWEALGEKGSVCAAAFPEYNPAYTVEDSVTYPVQFNGKMRFTVEQPKSASPTEVEAFIRNAPQTAKYVGEGNIVKVIVVPGRIINVVVK